MRWNRHVADYDDSYWSWLPPTPEEIAYDLMRRAQDMRFDDEHIPCVSGTQMNEHPEEA